MDEKFSDKLELILNDNNTIESFSRYGSIGGSIKWTGTLPEDFEGKFKPSFYLLKNGDIVENPDYVEPAFDVPSEPSKLEKQVATMSYQQMLTSQDMTTLQKQNAQMAYQLMQLEGRQA